MRIWYNTAFLQSYPPPIIIDELQYAPQILPLVKMTIDRHPDMCGQFWFTGSQQFHLMRDASESLAGRIGILDPVEVKKTASPRLSNIHAFAKVRSLGLPLGKGAVLCLSERARPLTQDVSVIPVGSI